MQRLPLTTGTSIGVLLAIPTFLWGQTAPKSIESRSAPTREYRLFVGVDVKILHEEESVSYTHLTLPTKRIV